MKNFIFCSIITVIFLGLSGCKDGNPKLTGYQLTPTEHEKVVSVAKTYFESAVDGNVQGTFQGCSGQDSDHDGNVTCNGKEPYRGFLRSTSILCSYDSAAGCKSK